MDELVLQPCTAATPMAGTLPTRPRVLSLADALDKPFEAELCSSDQVADLEERLTESWLRRVEGSSDLPAVHGQPPKLAAAAIPDPPSAPAPLLSLGSANHGTGDCRPCA